ncbi:MAG: RHS repeat-associated core domain-containing protein, partial [Acidobacteriota bacterium]
MDRLVTATGGNALAPNKQTEYVERFSYSASHNLLAKRRTHTITPRGGVDVYPPHTNINFEYRYDDRPHAPTRVGDLWLRYDPSGNVVERKKEGTGAVETLTWDDDGRLIEVLRQGAYQRNYFDSTGSRVIKKSQAGETLYASEYFDLHNGQRATKHIFASGQRVASVLSHYQAPTLGDRTPPGQGGTPPGQGGTPPGQTDPLADPSPPDAPGHPYYFHQDHLGSTSVLTDPDGEVHEVLLYFPDGEVWIENGPRRPVNGYRFTGKPTDPETGFADFGQRFYDPQTSLWLAVDPAFSDEPSSAIGKPLLLASYAYAAHSPMAFVDPDGRDVADFFIKAEQKYRISRRSEAVAQVATGFGIAVAGCAGTVGFGCWAALGAGAEYAGEGVHELVTGRDQPGAVEAIAGPRAAQAFDAAVAVAGIGALARSMPSITRAFRSIGRQANRALPWLSAKAARSFGGLSRAADFG